MAVQDTAAATLCGVRLIRQPDGWNGSHMEWIKALILGCIEGLTEFIPVSSTGHLILAGAWMDFKGPGGHVFEVVIQFGAIAAVCWLYRQRLWGVAVGVLKREQDACRFALALAVGVLPAAVAGVALHHLIKAMFYTPQVVAMMLVVGGVAILVIERLSITPKLLKMEEISPLMGLKIGLCQMLALVPGTSRSGATILGSVLLGVERKLATEFSFFLAIPTMLGAACYDLWRNWGFLTPDDHALIVIGFAAAFFSAMLVVSRVVAFIGTHGFAPFGWYRILVGAFMLTLFW
jgi:undecaprenyl-diphosphatase